MDDNHPITLVVLGALPVPEAGLLGGVLFPDALVLTDELLLVRALDHPEVDNLDGCHGGLLSNSSSNRIAA
jgi:hypothetical protein